MKKHIYEIFGTLLCALTIASCSDDKMTEKEPTDTRSPRVVLVYMVAQNNLSSYALSDRDEMKRAALNGDLGNSRLLVYYDTKNEDPVLEELVVNDLGEAEFKKLAEYDDETLSVSCERLETVINDAKEMAPARKYGLIFWGHGTGYLQNGVEEPLPNPLSTPSMIAPLSYGCETVGRKDYWMNVTSMARALKDKKIDWIYFDCCFMAGVEVAYELRDVTDYIVASVTEIPADGMPYHKTLKYLMTEEKQLGQAACATYDYYNAMTGSNRTCTMSVINTAGLDNLATVVKFIYGKAKTAPSGYVPQSYQTNYDHSRYGWSYYDLKHYLSALAPTINVDLLNVDIAFSQVVTNAYATPMLWNEVALSNHSGLSTLIIEKADDPAIAAKGYNELQWWHDVVEQRF